MGGGGLCAQPRASVPATPRDLGIPSRRVMLDMAWAGMYFRYCCTYMDGGVEDPAAWKAVDTRYLDRHMCCTVLAGALQGGISPTRYTVCLTLSVVRDSP